MSARNAFNTFGRDETLTDAQFDKLLTQLERNLFDHDDDDGYIGILDGAPITATKEETDDELLYRLGLGDRAAEEELAFQERHRQEDDL